MNRFVNALAIDVNSSPGINHSDKMMLTLGYAG
jgi:hypothetical protein